MTSFPIEQALFGRDGNNAPVLWTHSTGFHADWLPEAEALILAFGMRPLGATCPRAIFARPFDIDQVAVVQVADRPGGLLAFHFLVLERTAYEKFAGDPFHLADMLPASWERTDSLPTLSWPCTPLPRRTVEDVRRVLQRLKPEHAANGAVDPASIERTPENSESPALLGSAQVLVEGGRVVFERPGPDTLLLQGLWTLLPTSTRNRLWPASFVFGNELPFDVLVVPHAVGEDYAGYITEAQAIEYPEGHYELNLQIAAEAGNQEELDALFDRRSSRQVWQLLLVLFGAALVLSVFIATRDRLNEDNVPIETRRAVSQSAAAAGMIGCGDPWTALGIYGFGKSLWSQPQGGKP